MAKPSVPKTDEPATASGFESQAFRLFERIRSWFMRPVTSKHDGRTKYVARLARVAAGRKRQPARKPFEDYARSKWIKAFEIECIRRRERAGGGYLTALFKWTYGDERAPDEVLWFGLGVNHEALFGLDRSPLFSMIEKKADFRGDMR